MASSFVNRGSNKPPLASKQATYKIVSSKPKNLLSLFSNSLCKLLVPHINLTEASVRFICGTNNLHRELENKLSRFLGFEDTILYVACFDANGGLFEPLFTKEDAIISDALNHASIIDGIRLCKAQRYRYDHSDMDSLENCLKEAVKNNARHKVIATDGVFSMDGTYAKLDEICELANSQISSNLA